MSDNIPLPEGAGTLLATDEILGVHVLRAKVQTGVDGTAVDVSQNNPLPVGLVGSLPAGANTVGAVHVKPDTAGGLSVYRHTGLSTTGQVVKSSPGQVFGWHLANWGSSEAFVKFYNTSAAPTVGTTEPALTLMVPAGQVISAEHTNGIAFTNGIGIGATSAASDNNTSQPGANTMIVNVFYK
ncbi:hypothetical protein BE20_15970 [Sorangium cellulosum]|uniref:Uncharacterized protein n=1 Tax=Sorangium cellulosum TaxID=56 RepID=A0A150SEU3_SORCE|nr:hypothetical protein BE18_27185 [Sorangium cellulosum]KYF91023.1 hypothetical protein BE20_15970 [Sorangium cellulosum]